MTDNQEAQQKMLGTDTDTKKRDSPRRDKTKSSLRRVLALLRPYRWCIVTAAIMPVLTTGLGLLFPLVVRTFLNTIIGQHNDRLLNLVLNDGRIVERGTHQELLALDGLYARLYTRNFQDLGEPMDTGPEVLEEAVGGA